MTGQITCGWLIVGRKISKDIIMQRIFKAGHLLTISRLFALVKFNFYFLYPQIKISILEYSCGYDVKFNVSAASFEIQLFGGQRSVQYNF